MVSAARWYPDPTGRHQSRYWDSGRWTQHVSDFGVRSVDPVDFGDDTRHVYVDERVSVGLRRRRLLVTDVGVTWGERSVRYADLTGIAYWVMAAIGPNRTYELRLWERGRPVKVRFIGSDPATRAHYDATVGALLAHAGGAMMRDAIDRVAAGETVEFGGWTLDRHCAVQRGKRVAWTTPIQFVETIELFGGWWVRAVVDGRHTEIGLILRDVANGPLLRELFDECLRRFGTRL